MNAVPFEIGSAPLREAVPSLSFEKKSLRRQMKALLKSLRVDRERAALGIFRNLAALPEYRDAETIAIYLDFATEAPTRPFLPLLFRRFSTDSEPKRTPYSERAASDAADAANAATSRSFLNGSPLILDGSTPSGANDATSTDLSTLFPTRDVRRRVAVPFCDGPELRFYRIDEPTVDARSGRRIFRGLAPSSFGILEPTDALRADPTRSVSPTEFDVALVPGLAFDADGGRLGRGAGYYDRYLPRLSPKTRTIGIAFDEQIVDSVPTSTLDFRVSTVVTPTRILGRFAN